MANHGYVKTKKPMTAEAIQVLVEELNRTTFKNGFQIERDGRSWYIVYPKDSSVEPSYPLWLDYTKPNYGSRSFWLNCKPNAISSRSFEMRHGGGTNFIWWADTVILDNVARKFNGTISDDGVESKWKPPEQDCTLAEYFQKLSGKHGVLLDELMFVPPEFRDELKDLTWFKIVDDDGRAVIQQVNYPS